MAADAAISSALSLGAKLLPFVHELAEDLSSSSSQPNKGTELEEDLLRLMRLLEMIKATLNDANEREIEDHSVALWLLEVGRAAYKAEDVLDKYYYEVLRVKAEAAGGATAANPRKRKFVEILGLDGDQIKKITDIFDEIQRDRTALYLHMEDEGKKYSTSDFVVEHKIFGREKEKEELINLLFSECPAGGVVSVGAVVGMGGIGKTSLVQLAYDDQRIRQKFHEVGWICVSENFNVERMTREALKSITNQDYNINNLSALQERLSKEIRGKRLLLVLDDMWNDNERLWESFCTPFTSAKFVKIVITTRNERVAGITKSKTIFGLRGLSDDTSWQLFEHYAFGGINHNDKPNLVEIGRKIMEKCGMYPLSTKLVASMLRHEAEEESWREILESYIWECSGHEVLPALFICYARLPAYLKPCFSYCSMFPKNHEYNAEDLSQLWVSQGYIESRKGKSIQTGQEYVKQLWQRSFFDCQFKGSDFKNRKLKLHDLLHDFAMYISNKGFLVSSQREIHLYVMNNMKLVEPLSSHSLRTLSVGNNVESFLTVSDISKLLSLRVLDLKSQCCDSEFLPSIGNLKHLRYLSLGSFSFERLPESIGSLYNLQTLALTQCHFLEELPNCMRNLVNLQVLHLSCCSRFQRLPECLGSFQNLEKLVLDKCDIRALPPGICRLGALQEVLVTGCRNLKDLPEDIGRLSALETLVIEETGVRYLPSSLNNVRGLKKLLLTYYKKQQAKGRSQY